MKQKQVINAYNALLRLAVINLPLKEAYKIFCLRKVLEQPYTFEMERERRLLEEVGGVIKLDGSIFFKDEESAIKFNDGIAEMNDMEIAVEYEPVHMSMDDLESVQITPEDIERLEGFVIFE